MAIRESGENYLEAIFILRRERGFVRSIDVACYLGVSKPSVSRAMSILKSEDYIEIDEDGGISLTSGGLSVAESMYERHQLLTEYLISLRVNREVAARDACRIEHVISAESFERLREHARTYIENLNK